MIFICYQKNSEDWDNGDYALTSFGMTNFANVTLFVAKSSLDSITDLGDITGNLIIFPNNKVMEITDVDSTVPGVNNLFTYDDVKSVYKLTCKPHAFKLIDEVDNVDISVDPEVPYETLDVYFQELVDRAVDQDDAAEVIPTVDTVDKTEALNTKVKKPIVDLDEDDVWGKFS